MKGTPMNASVRYTAVVAVTSIVLCACESAPKREGNTYGYGPALVEQPQFTIKASSHRVYAGEIVTVATRSANLAGRSSEVQWASTGGELTAEEEGVLARVRFDRPGTYFISGTLIVDGEPVETESITITVMPVMR